MPPPHSFIRLASCCSLVKRSSFWNSTVRSLWYTTCSDVADSSSSDTCRHPVEKVGKFKAINESLEQWKREGSSALPFLRELKESGFKHDLETYMSVVRLLCRWDWGLDVRSNKMLKYVIKNTDWEIKRFEMSDHLFEALVEEKLIKGVEVLVEVYASAGRFEEAIHAMSEMKSRSGVMVSTGTCNFVIKGLIKQCKTDMVESVYRQMKGNGLINPNVHTFGILMKGYCKKGRLKKAWGLFEEMEEAGVEPNAFVYSMYIHGLCCKGKTDVASQLLKKLRESNKPVDVVAYASVIRGFVKESKMQDAKDVLLDMKLRGGVVPDKYCYCFLVAGYCQKGDIDTALDLWKEMESRDIKTDHSFVRWMMDYLCGLGKLDEALTMFKHFMQQPSPSVFLDSASFKIAVDAACKLGKTDDAMGLVQEMKGRKINPLVVMQAPTPTPTDDQGVQPNVDQQDEGLPHAAVGGYVGQAHTTQQSLITVTPHDQLTSLNAHHAVILLKKLSK